MNDGQNTMNDSKKSLKINDILEDEQIIQGGSDNYNESATVVAMRLNSKLMMEIGAKHAAMEIFKTENDAKHQKILKQRSRLFIIFGTVATCICLFVLWLCGS